MERIVILGKTNLVRKIEIEFVSCETSGVANMKSYRVPL